MPRKPGLNSEFVMFDVLYEDGTQRSNRKVPRTLTGGIDGDKPAHGFLIEQDRDIAEKSGRPACQDQEHQPFGGAKKRTRLFRTGIPAAVEVSRRGVRRRIVGQDALPATCSRCRTRSTKNCAGPFGSPETTRG